MAQVNTIHKLKIKEIIIGNEFDELKDKMKEVKNNLENTGEETKGAVLYFYYIASFLVPLFGLVMFFLKKTKEPNLSKNCLYVAIAGFVFGIILRLILS